MGQKGFTLIEFIVYVALLAILLTLTVQFILSVIESAARMDAKEEVQKNAAAITRAFEHEVRHSHEIYTPTSDFVSDPGQLSLLSSINLPPDENETYTDIYLHNGRFCIKWELTGADCVTSSSVEVTSLTFTRIEQSPTVESARMVATLRFDSPRVEYFFTETLYTTARLRNY